MKFFVPLAFFLAVFLGAKPARSGTVIVGPGGDINDAIRAASDGDLILIDDGLYGPVSVSKEVTLQAVHTGKAVVDGGGPSANISAVTFSARATIVGLRIQNAHEGTYQRDVGVNYTVKQCIFDNCGAGLLNGQALGAAIEIDNSSGTQGSADVINCDILNCITAATINDGGTINLTNCIVDNCTYGYVIWDGIAINPSHNLLHNVATVAVPTWGTVANDPAQLVGDPMFVDPTHGDYHLLSGSPAIDSGMNVGLPFSGAAPDRGAFEDTSVPEPATMALLGLAVTGLGGYIRRRRS